MLLDCKNKQHVSQNIKTKYTQNNLYMCKLTQHFNISNNLTIISLSSSPFTIHAFRVCPSRGKAEQLWLCAWSFLGTIPHRSNCFEIILLDCFLVLFWARTDTWKERRNKFSKQKSENYLFINQLLTKNRFLHKIKHEFLHMNQIHHLHRAQQPPSKKSRAPQE